MRLNCIGKAMFTSRNWMSTKAQNRIVHILTIGKHSKMYVMVILWDVMVKMIYKRNCTTGIIILLNGKTGFILILRNA